MSAAARIVASCLCGKERKTTQVSHSAGSPLQIVEKQPLIVPKPAAVAQNPTKSPGYRTVDDIASDVVTIIRTAEECGDALKARLDETVGAEGWSEWLAEKVLKGLEAAIKEGRDRMGKAMAEAYDEAIFVREEVFPDLVRFAKEHPLEIAAAVVVTIAAIGVLVYLAPSVLELLGFGELGPIRGTFAAWWQSRYRGYVPKEALFCFFQRLGMIWGKA